ncbi:hypothetical protein OH77DRAFT_1409252 [Trametes cingulata]|nr:hypothetical protein OH77DRAFT_1409252 [Trametes cingulata]
MCDCSVLSAHGVHAFSQQTTSQSLLPSAVLRALSSSNADHEGERDARVAGGLSRDDLAKMAPVALPVSIVLKDAFLNQLEDELKSTLLAIADYYSPGDEAANEEDRLQTAASLPAQIRARKAALAQQHTLLHESRTRVLELIEHINDTHPALDSSLLAALSALPPEQRATRTAHADVLAATIEAALLKLSLLRARAHRALYGFSVPPPSAHEQQKEQKTLSRAIAHAHLALLRRQRAQDEEMRALDAQLAAYEGVLRLVDGGGGGGIGGGRAGEGEGEGAFGQVVRDMARVKRETEECRRDLRRLGWTGD